MTEVKAKKAIWSVPTMTAWLARKGGDRFVDLALIQLAGGFFEVQWSVPREASIPGDRRKMRPADSSPPRWRGTPRSQRPGFRGVALESERLGKRTTVGGGRCRPASSSAVRRSRFIEMVDDGSARHPLGQENSSIRSGMAKLTGTWFLAAHADQFTPRSIPF